MFNWLKNLAKGFGELLNEPSWDSLRVFLRTNWPALLLFIILIFVIAYIVSKIFEIVVKIALVIFLIWFIFMLLFKRKELMEGLRNIGKGSENSQQTNNQSDK
ncbi:hypothetical protein [endosymbiont GvMRE of Glomus versiforme]|uniref:hypothetical protein n=1 Tax=endosymbiont GvMRE of Glomus versiforme TaxID=2039283 RepID=UPI000ECA73AC|nr:hypothetical protein [endosymbiont GvMRE of Glomus versiforme]RHZ37322.1 hypothetical protein GvMRE_I1g86 [endosymbiont GvMRE of Glomus versiforme]